MKAPTFRAYVHRTPAGFGFAVRQLHSTTTCALSPSTAVLTRAEAIAAAAHCACEREQHTHELNARPDPDDPHGYDDSPH
ncbi:hypothetical protein HHL22_11965 [Hymenobacter sp. RP-2-7]|uniref:Uncharacterized protein n=1 Tax=Hymenobacter polaris TaxID=2682546 RepID=A0A7Y0FMJ5_9BACT|nr:hypothetical protein [Hymenobacter polaris]NML65922.1 hypothetical protein [Hymenobacter polaris]